MIRIIILLIIVLVLGAIFLPSDGRSLSHKELCQSVTIELSGYEACDQHNFCNLTTQETNSLIRLRKDGIMECRRDTTERAFFEMNEKARIQNERI